jgi:hypothetical protein
MSLWQNLCRRTGTHRKNAPPRSKLLAKMLRLHVGKVPAPETLENPYRRFFTKNRSFEELTRK